MKPTIKNINEAIAARYPGLDIEFVKGKGYFYFAGDDGLGEIDSIMVFALNQMTMEKWLEVVFGNIDDRHPDATIGELVLS